MLSEPTFIEMSILRTDIHEQKLIYETPRVISRDFVVLVQGNFRCSELVKGLFTLGAMSGDSLGDDMSTVAWHHYVFV